MAIETGKVLSTLPLFRSPVTFKKKEAPKEQKHELKPCLTAQVDLSAVKNIINSSFDPETYIKHNEIIPFEVYINKVIENPKLIRTSSQRIYEMISSKGYEPIEIDGETLYRYNFFTKPQNPKYAISGIEKPIHKLIETLRGAANASGPNERIILLVGPVGSAKTTIVKIIKQGLEAYTKTDDGALYSIEWDLKDEKGDSIFNDLPKQKPCSVHDDPFKLIPNQNRQTIVETLNKNLRENAKKNNEILTYEFQSDGSVCPSCNNIFHRLLEHYKGNINEVWKHIKAKRVLLDEDTRVGLTTYEPKDEKTHQAGELTGAVNLNKLMKLGRDSDPQAFDFDGELCLSNRGLAHFDEFLKLPKEMLHILLTAAQDRKYKAPKLAQIAFDGFLIGTTNMPDWDAVKKNRFLEAIRNRIIAIPTPYNGKINDEMKIYNKSFLRSAERTNVHVSPHTVWLASMWAVMTRLAEPKGNITMVQKALLYNGEELKDFTRSEILQMKRDVPEEANELKKGISPRTIENALSSALSHPDVSDPKTGSRCVSPYLVLDSLEAELTTGIADVTQQEKDKYKSMLKDVENELDLKLKKDVHKAIAGDEKAVENLFNSYKANVIAWRKKERVENKITKRMEEPDEALMRAVEDKLGVTDANRTEYRKGLIERIGMAPSDRPFAHKTDESLRRALEDVLIEKYSDIKSLPDTSSEAASPEQKKQLQIIKSRLTEKFAYCEHCADIALARARSPKNRGASSR